MKITESAFYQMINHIGAQPAESGGAGFGYESDNVIRDFVPDLNAKTTPSTYAMNTPFLNKEIETKWEKEKKSLLAIAHAHKHGLPDLSGPDRAYFKDLLSYMPRKKFYAPVLYTIPDGGLKVFPYVYEKGSDVPKKVRLEIVPDDYEEQQETVVQKSEKSEGKQLNISYYIFAGIPEKKPSLREKVSSFLTIIISVGIIYCVVFLTAFYAACLLTELVLKYFAL